MNLEWFHWAIFGLGLIVIELVVPMLVLIWFGLGGLVVALIMAVNPSLPFIPQMLIWGVTSSLFVVSWFKIFKPWRHKTLAGRSSAQVVGEVGILVNDIAPFQKSQVRFQMPVVGSDVWDCVSDQSIKAGTRVRIISIDGNILKVAQKED